MGGKEYKISRLCTALIVIINIFDCVSTKNVPSMFGKNVHGVEKRIKSIVPPSKEAGGSNNDICMKPGCISAAHNILKNMDAKIDPCDDFFEFACGNFLKETLIPDDKVAVSQFSIVDDMLMDQLKIIFNEPIKDDDLKPFKQAKSIFNTCMDREKIEKTGLTPVKDLLKRLGGWPVLENNWNEESFSWQEMIYKFRKEGSSVSVLIDFSVALDIKNTTTRVIDIDQPPLGISREFLVKGFENHIVNAYYNYMIDIAVIFGAERYRAAEELRKSLEFEMNLANITLPREERRDANKLYHPMKITEAQEKFSVVPWLKYINTILAPTNVITENETIVIAVPDYLKKLNILLSFTPKRVIANFFLWRLVASTIFFLTKEVRDRQLQFNAAVTGRVSREPRWRECIDYSVGSFPLAIGSLYIRRYFNEESRKKALEMVGDIRQEMYRMLNTVEWMDNSTKAQALDKAYAIVNHIGYPDELRDDTKLLKFYEKLNVNASDYFGSLMNMSRFWTDYSLSRLRLPVNKTDWTTHGAPAVVNAFYHPLENSIQFPAGILQHIFFSQDRPRYLNYGAIGFVIAHEITHAFDDQGRQFDKDGNLVEWWSPETKKLFTEKAKCFIQQSSNYTPKGSELKLKGVNTQGEVIADNGGIRNSYHAYLNYVKKHGNEPKLPGLQNYSSNQMFWIGAANVWCAKYRPETLKLNVETGVHPPCEFRVTGTFANQEEFARDFNCPVGSKMNPVTKCRAW